MTKENKIHKTHFTVPELPYKKKEREAILLLKQILFLHADTDLFMDEVYDFYKETENILSKNKDLVDWVMKYKGE